jgi:hypothetical protein
LITAQARFVALREDFERLSRVDEKNLILAAYIALASQVWLSLEAAAFDSFWPRNETDLMNGGMPREKHRSFEPAILTPAEKKQAQAHSQREYSPQRACPRLDPSGCRPCGGY